MQTPLKKKELKERLKSYLSKFCNKKTKKPTSKMSFFFFTSFFNHFLHTHTYTHKKKKPISRMSAFCLSKKKKWALFSPPFLLPFSSPKNKNKKKKLPHIQNELLFSLFNHFLRTKKPTSKMSIFFPFLFFKPFSSPKK